MKIALIGLDGSGKSANISLMKEDSFYSEFDFLWVRWQPSVSKWIYKIKHRNDTVGARINDVTSEKKQNELNNSYQKKGKIKKKLFSINIIRKVWMWYSIKDYKAQFYKKTHRSIENDTDIIFDRYYLDLFIDQGINFGYSPEQIYNEVVRYERLFPKMDRVIYINVSPEVCFARKDDIPNMEYLNTRYQIYKYLCEKQKWTVVDGEQPLENVYQNIKQIVRILGENDEER